MKQISVQENFLHITPDSEQNPDSIIKEVFNKKCDKFEKVYIDLSGFNPFKTIRLVAIISAKGLIKNHNTAYEFFIDNEFSQSQIKSLHLSNVIISK